MPDELGQRPVTIPHFPAGVLPPSAGDSEATIYNSTTQLLHSFDGMSLSGGMYSAAVYACESAQAGRLPRHRSPIKYARVAARRSPGFYASPRCRLVPMLVLSRSMR